MFIIISVVACGVSIAVFALVSLGHFVYTPSRTVIPVVGKMYESTVEQIALLEPVPVPQTAKPASNPPTPPPSVSPPPASHKPFVSDQHKFNKKDSARHQRNHKATAEREFSYNDLQKALAALFKEWFH